MEGWWMIWRILCWKRRKKTARFRELEERALFLGRCWGRVSQLHRFLQGGREKSFVSFPPFLSLVEW